MGFVPLCCGHNLAIGFDSFASNRRLKRMHTKILHSSDFRPSRRRMLTGSAALVGTSALVASAGSAFTQDVADLSWQDLIPTGAGESVDRLDADGYVQHEEMEMLSGFSQPVGTGVVEELNNKKVRLPGFMVPMVMTAEGVSSFILVPYMGACVHVPPPPPNQIVFVTTPQPFSEGTLFRAVRVTGYLETQTIDTDVAQIGYVLDAEHIELYEGQYG